MKTSCRTQRNEPKASVSSSGSITSCTLIFDEFRIRISVCHWDIFGRNSISPSPYKEDHDEFDYWNPSCLDWVLNKMEEIGI